MKKFLFLAVITAAFFSCGPKIYKSSNFSTALARHKNVAIIPAEITVQLRPTEAKKLTPEQINELTSKMAYDIQEKMYGWFLRKGDRYHYTVKFQDVTKTNSLLKDAGIAYSDLKTTDRAKLAKILGVDAVLQDRTSMEKPMSEGAAVAVGLLVGAWGATNKVQTTINIYDGTSSDLLWKYDYEASGSVGSSSTQLVDALMRNASKKFPYTVK